MSLPVIRQAERIDLPQAAQLACQLCPEHNISEMLEEMTDAFGQQAVFLAFIQQQTVGFAQVSLRRDYVEGTSTSPVGYLEGIFVLPRHRSQRIARQLLSACEDWAAAQGCREFASDCEPNNDDSLHFHLASGFTEAGRIIYFTKALAPQPHPNAQKEHHN